MLDYPAKTCLNAINQRGRNLRILPPLEPSYIVRNPNCQSCTITPGILDVRVRRPIEMTKSAENSLVRTQRGNYLGEFGKAPTLA
jgi:hypothetical protein